MLAPGSYQERDGLVKNKDAKPITFVKKNGRISLKMGKRSVGGERLVIDRIREMKMEVEKAEKGSTVSTMKDFGPGSAEYKRHGIKSSFPKWFGELGFNSKKDFIKVLNSKKGVRYDRLVNRAIDDLSTGYSSSYGRIPPSEEFQVKSRQKFDNRGVVFRVIDGKVRPIRGGGPRFSDEVPF